MPDGAAHDFRRGPGVKAGVCSHTFATTVDILPTIAAIAHVKEPLPKGIEGGSLATVLGGAANASVKRAREELVAHFPHYDKDEQGPASALVLGNVKLIHPYDTNVPMLFDLSKDMSEQHDLAKERAKETADLDRRLNEYLSLVNAGMPLPNPKYDASKAQPFQERRGGKDPGGKGKMKPDAQ